MPHELKDFMKMELIEDSTSDAEFSIGKNKNDLSTSCFEKVTNNDLQKTGVRLTNDMSQTICLFKKYLLAKSQHKIGKTNMEESEVIKGRSSSCPLVPPKFGSNFPRPHSFLEQKIIPGIRYDATQASSDDKPSTAQLTIFYAGNVNVYDNIPIDKAQTIMLLAGENSLSKPTATEMPKTEVKNSLHRSNYLTSVCKLQQDLPIARKLSLRHFLEKRRCRIVNKCPYSPPGTKHKDSEPTTEDDSDGNNDISLSPFPSRLGFFFPVSAKKD